GSARAARDRPHGGIGAGSNFYMVTHGARDTRHLRYGETNVIDQERRFALAVPELHTYTPTNGIGRVFTSLSEAWGDRVRLVPAVFAASSLPMLRNIPYGIRVSECADLVFLPKMTGAQALRNTSSLPSVVLVHDVGVIDELCNDRQMMDWFSYQSVRA